MPLRLKSSLETFQTEKNPTTRMNAHTRSQVVSAVQACEEKKGEEISILEMDKNSSAFTDYFVICSGKNPRQIQAIADEVELRLKREGVRANQVEGYNQADWVLIDYVDFVVHVFSEASRKFYDLERLWKSARKVTLDELNKPAARRKMSTKSVTKTRSKTSSVRRASAPGKSRSRNSSRTATRPRKAS
jgi:ribosome-associated protein